jgi:hypothetical protein
MDDTTSAPIPTAMPDLQPPGWRPPQAAKLSLAELNESATKQLRQPIALTEEAAFELTARWPYDTAGSMEFWQPARWDAEGDYILTDKLVLTSDGSYDNGSMGYVNYTAERSGFHLVAVHFSGYDTTLKMGGPWAFTSNYCPTLADTATVWAPWNAYQGSLLKFHMWSFAGMDLVGTPTKPLTPESGAAVIRAVQVRFLAPFNE